VFVAGKLFKPSLTNTNLVQKNKKLREKSFIKLAPDLCKLDLFIIVNIFSSLLSGLAYKIWVGLTPVVGVTRGFCSYTNSLVGLAV
jgi:hypothetical protein